MSVRTLRRVLVDVDWLMYVKVENTLPLAVTDMGARKSWAKKILLHEDAGSIWDSMIFSDEKNGIRRSRRLPAFLGRFVPVCPPDEATSSWR